MSNQGGVKFFWVGGGGLVDSVCEEAEGMRLALPPFVLKAGAVYLPAGCEASAEIVKRAPYDFTRFPHRPRA